VDWQKHLPENPKGLSRVFHFGKHIQEMLNRPESVPEREQYYGDFIMLVSFSPTAGSDTSVWEK
jgi:hypothetical protein